MRAEVCAQIESSENPMTMQPESQNGQGQAGKPNGAAKCRAKLRYLQPDRLKVSTSSCGSLCIQLDGEECYDKVTAYRALPLSSPEHYISLRVGTTQSDQREIGVIRDLSELDPEIRKLIEAELAKRYFIHTISKIHSIREKYAFLYWDVETDKGRRQFAIPGWAHRHVIESGLGRIIQDVDGNRYSIPDLEALDDHSRAVFNQIIYWSTSSG
ncbi:MAG: DUF1854 domain-containing protein [Firmicutes bacterium]|nr:DUF1854 domain-containing protein [Bacillota bacterium]